MSDMIEKMIRSEFDEEIEIPDISLENINKVLKKMDEITYEMLNPFDSVLDKMVKDIRDRQDNVMAMEFTKCIGELLRKNGVTPKITEYQKFSPTFDKIGEEYGVTIDELDFSEHDKVFENKIAELKKDYKTASGLLGKYQQENEALKKRIQELDAIDAMRIDEKRELKQRIAELEEENERKDAVNKCWSDHVHDLHKENVRLIHDIDKITKSKSEWIDRVVEWQQKCDKLENKETETCENEPKMSDSAPSREWYENRHQSDCIEINRLSTTIDVLIHKIEYLRQFAGLE